MAHQPHKPPTIGGQAVMEGVMMRGVQSWAVAVRTPQGDVAVQAFDLRTLAQRRPWLKWPFLRGVYVLAESLAIGMRALMISANYSVEEEDRLEPKAMGWTLTLALVMFAGLFVVLPALATKLSAKGIGFLRDDLVANIVESTLRLSMFVGYLFAISMLSEVRRLFQYHGAEHKTIYAYEAGDPLEPPTIDRYTTLHVRCGTNFLFIVMFLTFIFHFVMDLVLPASIPLRISVRVLGIPLLAGAAYELIKAASRNEDSAFFRLAMLPGLALQKVTTRPPSSDQIEVAVSAIQAVIARESAEPA